jgi:hypothetical protein
MNYILKHQFNYFRYSIGQGNELTPQVAFTVLSLINVISTPLKLFPMILSSISAAYVSFGRVQTFLLSKVFFCYLLNLDNIIVISYFSSTFQSLFTMIFN